MMLFCFVHNSIKHTDEKNLNCDGGNPMEVPAEFNGDVSIIYTYAVTFEVGLLTLILITCN